jgi:hypothetical protein
MLRKQLLNASSATTSSPTEKDITALATVLMSSEDPDHPVDNAFDTSRGPGGSRWVAAESGEQRLILAFDTPQRIRTVSLEFEELDVTRTQELQLSVSSDGGQSYQELRRQEYTFSPGGATFEREQWSITAEGVTHLQLVITPDKGNKPCRAVLTSLVLQ